MAKTFDFDVSSANPRWLSDVEDEVARPARRPHEIVQHLPAPNPAFEQRLGVLMEMGFQREAAVMALQLSAGDLEGALNALVQ